MIIRSKDRFKLVPAVYLVLFRDNDKGEKETLLLKRRNTGFMDGHYSMVAGHLDGGETIMTAMIREAKEEAGIILKHEDLKIVHTMHRKAVDHERIDFFITTKAWEGQITNKEPDKCSELKWFTISNLPDKIVEYVKCAVDNIENKIYYSEHGW